MAFTIDITRPIVILSHPRSGSTWIQDSLPQFNLSELFTMYCGIKSVNLDTGIQYNYSTTAANDLDYRFDLFDMFLEKHKAISVKTHLHLLTEPICDFFEKKDLQYILLKRKNKRDTFWSLLIALNTLELHNTINKKSIRVTNALIDDALYILDQCDKNTEMVTNKFNPLKICYEDMLTLPKNNWWKPSNKYVIQNAKDVVTIENINEVTEYLKKILAPPEYI